MKKLFGILMTVLVLSEVNAVQAQGLEEDIDLTTIDCRTLLTMDGDEQDFTLLFFHGFMSAKNNQMVINLDELGTATDQVVTYCIDNPNETLLNTFTQFRPAP
ncbi:HdeA/HdeB family chaperone [Gloeocapsa sp. PCC 73106]|uniref:HdeA/HdeB family chaperone n=1 Tax=Gloeocapsa sp. PCC 73106 TaxID=102232 RepID=UPI0002ACCD9E|nr:HdeA/HdeB family chaperone [Gloeocapsa sp. PCC 73106]ELR97413.1 hypothetical protein GLO73106DRAFT_00012230 [Gloeocapsa sp. PCC 73106]